MSFVVDKNKKRIIIRLKSKIKRVYVDNAWVSPLKLTYKRNNVTSSALTPSWSNGTYTWAISTRNFSDDDELTDFTIYYDGEADFTSLEEGVTILLDGEDVGEIRNTNTYTAKFDEIGEHTIQALYKGNKNYMTATTPITTFYVKQEEAGGGGTVPVSEIYWMEFTDLSKSTFKYADGSSVSAKLTKGGVPIGGAEVELTVLSATTGYSYTATTQANGIVNLKLNRLPVGSHTLIATYEVDNEVVCSSQKKIKIIKNDPLIDFAKQGGTAQSTFYAGDEIWIRFREPDNTAINDKTVPIYVNGKVYNIMTNVNGRVWLRLYYRGTYRFKAVYGGNSNLNSKTYNFTVTVR